MVGAQILYDVLETCVEVEVEVQNMLMNVDADVFVVKWKHNLQMVDELVMMLQKTVPMKPVYNWVVHQIRWGRTIVVVVEEEEEEVVWGMLVETWIIVS